MDKNPVGHRISRAQTLVVGGVEKVLEGAAHVAEVGRCPQDDAVCGLHHRSVGVQCVDATNLHARDTRSIGSHQNLFEHGAQRWARGVMHDEQNSHGLTR